jgi:hypothetical protein
MTKAIFLSFLLDKDESKFNMMTSKQSENWKQIHGHLHKE